MLTITKSVPSAGSYDVVVCGGGPSGWVAATAAARAGCRTAVIERFGFFGGTATAGLVVPVSGFFKNGTRVVGGIPWEFIGQMEKNGAAVLEMPKGHISVDTEYYKLIAQRIVVASGVDIFMNSYISYVIENNGHVSAVIIENKGGSEAVEGRVFVDATGDGDVLWMAGADMDICRQPQPLSLCFELIGLDCTTPLLKDSIHHDGRSGHSVNTQINRFLEKEYRLGTCPMFGGPWFNTLVKGDRIAVNITRSPATVLDNREYAQAEFQLREDMFALTEILREHYPEFTAVRSQVLLSMPEYVKAGTSKADTPSPVRNYSPARTFPTASRETPILLIFMAMRRRGKYSRIQTNPATSPTVR